MYCSITNCPRSVVSLSKLPFEGSQKWRRGSGTSSCSLDRWQNYSWPKCRQTRKKIPESVDRNRSFQVLSRKGWASAKTTTLVTNVHSLTKSANSDLITKRCKTLIDASCKTKIPHQLILTSTDRTFRSFIKGLDPYYILALGHTAPFHQMQALRSGFLKYLEFNTSISVKIPVSITQTLAEDREKSETRWGVYVFGICLCFGLVA